MHMLSFENFVKSMQPSLSELKVTPGFCFAFKIPDDVAASTLYVEKFNLYLKDYIHPQIIKRKNGKFLKLLRLLSLQFISSNGLYKFKLSKKSIHPLFQGSFVILLLGVNIGHGKRKGLMHKNLNVTC